MTVRIDNQSQRTFSKRKRFQGISMLGILMLAVVALAVSKNNVIQAEIEKNGDLRILKSEVTHQVKFYPYMADGVKMEVLAVKASDGSIRTAFNTCQVCFDSGRGYYIQEGNELVCQNCGSRFPVDRIEKIKNGCNPVPITADLKKDDGKSITISKAILVKAKGLFGNWRK